MPSNKTEKKRKRDSDRHERPSKKPARDLQALPPLAASVVDDSSELAPVITSTPGLQISNTLRYTPYSKTREHVSKSATTGRNPGIVSSELLLQSSDHEKMDFVGREGNEDAADSQIKHYVAVGDPERKTWQVVEARRMKVRGAVRSKKASEEEAMSDDEAMFSMRAQRTALTNTFGTKQAKKSAQSFAENAQLSNAPDGVVSQAGAALLSSLPADATTSAAKANHLQAEVQAAKPLPTPDLTAAHPSDVYPLETLVPNGHSTLRQLTQIEEWQEHAEQGRAISTVSRFVSNRIGPVVQSGNITQLQVLRLIQLLVEFGRCLKSGGRDAKGSAAPGSKRLPPREDLRRILSSTTGAAKGGKQSTDTAPQDLLPDSVIDAVRRRFAPTGGMVSKHDLTLLHTTICALSLHIPPQPAKDGGSSSLGGNSPNELATDPADLRDDLRLDSNTVYQYFRELGCRIDRPRESEFSKWNIKGGKAEAHARRVARLRVPVEFPKVSRGGRK
ncbi:hypothetical protein N7474_001607 [Penicillium riverlandense]|uniref:uncharacterized protein n=1 Tax=Penicillium riverlandense TaxID=1903569 RepID=UPI0025498CA0|nr:uncharacterized protein N7474_001607 [Penicillium riverlandense]KAJ5833296.1 hypothetical protein N7474_001607 [Penicillium riverlandense]